LVPVSALGSERAWVPGSARALLTVPVPGKGSEIGPVPEKELAIVRVQDKASATGRVRGKASVIVLARVMALPIVRHNCRDWATVGLVRGYQIRVLACKIAWRITRWKTAAQI
jgi:hypothetical protein